MARYTWNAFVVVEDEDTKESDALSAAEEMLRAINKNDGGVRVFLDGSPAAIEEDDFVLGMETYTDADGILRYIETDKEV